MACCQNPLLVVAMILVGLLQSFTFFTTKLAIVSKMSPWVLAAFRQLVSFLVFVPIAVLKASERNKWPTMTKPILGKIILGSLFGALSNQSLFFIGCQYAFASAALHSAIPFVTNLLALLCRLHSSDMKNRVFLAKVIGAVMSLGGAIIMFTYNGPLIISSAGKVDYETLAGTKIDITRITNRITWLGPVLVLASGGSWSLWFLVQENLNEEFNAPMTTNALMSFIAFLISFAIGVGMENDHIEAWNIFKPRIRWIAVVVSGVFGSAASSRLMSYTTKEKGGIFVSAYGIITPLIVIISGWFLLEEMLHVGMVVGACLLILGLIIVIYWAHKEREQNQEREREIAQITNTDQLVNLQELGETSVTEQQMGHNRQHGEIVELEVPRQTEVAAIPMTQNQQDTRISQNVTPIDAGGSNIGAGPSTPPSIPRVPNVTNLSTTEAYCAQNEVTVSGDNVPDPFMTFEATGFPPDILEQMLLAGFNAPTPIQAQTWPIALQGRDIVAIAKTGSGKTLGYLIPAFMHLRRCRNGSQNGPTVLVLAPTRELATQIQEEVNKFGRSSRVSCTCLYGGAPKGSQLKELDRGTDIVVATPGRLNDILEMKKIDFRQISLLVLDEADRMLDMGFEPQIRKIVNEIPSHQQTLMYTATWPKEVRKIAGDLLVNHVQVNIGKVGGLAANKAITQGCLGTSYSDSGGRRSDSGGHADIRDDFGGQGGGMTRSHSRSRSSSHSHEGVQKSREQDLIQELPRTEHEPSSPKAHLPPMSPGSEGKTLPGPATEPPADLSVVEPSKDIRSEVEPKSSTSGC